jgi:hypothetical protein
MAARIPLPACFESAVEARREIIDAKRHIRYGVNRLMDAARLVNHDDWREVGQIASKIAELSEKLDDELPAEACVCEPFTDCPVCRNKKWITFGQKRERQVAYESLLKEFSERQVVSSETVQARKSAEEQWKLPRAKKIKKIRKSSASQKKASRRRSAVSKKVT